MDDFRAGIVSELPKMSARAMRLTRNRSAADDLVQDTVLRALTAEAQFQMGTNLGAWLMTIMLNLFRNERRHAVKFRESPLEINGEAIDLPALSNTEDTVLLKETIRAMRRIPSANCDALILIAFEARPYEEAAVIADCEVGTMKSRTSRGRAMLMAAISA